MKKKILALTLALCASLSAAAIPVSAEVETKSAAIANIDMSWPYIKADNKAATKAINSDLRVYMDDFRYDYMYRKFLSYFWEKWVVMDSNHRRHSQQIYSLPHLATLVTTQTFLFLSLLSDSNQRPRDYKSRALAN